MIGDGGAIAVGHIFKRDHPDRRTSWASAAHASTRVERENAKLEQQLDSLVERLQDAVETLERERGRRGDHA